MIIWFFEVWQKYFCTDDCHAGKLGPGWGSVVELGVVCFLHGAPTSNEPRFEKFVFVIKTALWIITMETINAVCQDSPLLTFHWTIDLLQVMRSRLSSIINLGAGGKINCLVRENSSPSTVRFRSEKHNKVDFFHHLVFSFSTSQVNDRQNEA